MAVETPDGSTTVHGVVVLPADGAPAGTVTVRVLVEDTSRADAPSTRLAEQEQLVDLAGVGTRIPFSVSVPPEALQSPWCVLRAHVDVDGSGRVSSGDLVSTQSIPLQSPLVEHVVDVRTV